MNRLFRTPAGMTRRHFLEHLAGASALAIPAINFTNSLAASTKDLKRRHKAAILLYMGGGPSTIDIWDMKPGAPTGGSFKPISTTGDMQICEHLPMMAKQMKHLSIVRSMSTREADHTRGRYYMHTGYVPNPTIEHPGYGSVVSHELANHISDLQIPPFVSVGGGSVGPGFLGMTYAPFVVDFNGDVKNAATSLKEDRLAQRMEMLASIEKSFIGQNRGEAAVDHAKVLEKTVTLFTSKQMGAFKINNETAKVRDAYGRNGFGNGCLMARRLVEEGVPFVEVDFGGWDMHNNVFTGLERQLGIVDKAMSTLIQDLDERGLLQDTVVLWMGEFGRTPRINGTAGRDHWARSWSVVVGGSGIKGGTTVGATNEDGTEVTTDPYKSEDLMASVLKALGISLETTFTSKNNRPMKIANSGRVIKELFA
ncbi:MAG TPA: DUF1501 domain-containing protein [Gemmataceae bacterium]|nr:DUF1501 domain-containing protein [Pirellulales bacterium]HZZ77265.1 DUF1501 domain-containing protein [Gemmataceae bacterium]